MIASVAGSDTGILGSAAGLIQTARATCDENWFIMAELCLPFRMTPSSPLLYWTVNLSRRSAMSRVRLVFDAHFVVGRHAKMTSGLAAAGMSGTPSIPEEF